ncbi:MAG: 2Fe-2S iron-sulfur cluster-binding protein [Janthinobacterium lividum]
MPVIRFIEFNGNEHAVEAPLGVSVMSVAQNNNIPGIDGDCGGLCACATCHVYVDPAWTEIVGGRGEQEDSMLTFSPILQDNSRLSCQIEVSEALDGLVLRMPEGQH